GGGGGRAGILTPAHLHARARVVGSGVDAARTGAVLGKDARVEVHVGEDGIGAALADPPVVRCAPRGRQPGIARRNQLTFYEVEELAARVAGAQGDVGGG